MFSNLLRSLNDCWWISDLKIDFSIMLYQILLILVIKNRSKIKTQPKHLLLVIFVYLKNLHVYLFISKSTRFFTIYLSWNHITLLRHTCEYICNFLLPNVALILNDKLFSSHVPPVEVTVETKEQSQIDMDSAEK